MVKGVIFDVDGVLLNSMPVWENLGELYLQKFGIQAEKDLSEILYEMSLKEASDFSLRTEADRGRGYKGDCKGSRAVLCGKSASERGST